MDEIRKLTGGLSRRILTRAIARISPTASKACLAGEYSAALLSRILILSSRSKIWASSVGVIIPDSVAGCSCVSGEGASSCPRGIDKI